MKTDHSNITTVANLAFSDGDKKTVIIPYKTCFLANDLERKGGKSYGHIDCGTAAQLFGVENDKQARGHANVAVQLEIEEALNLVRRTVDRVKSSSTCALA